MRAGMATAMVVALLAGCTSPKSGKVPAGRHPERTQVGCYGEPYGKVKHGQVTRYAKVQNDPSARALAPRETKEQEPPAPRTITTLAHPLRVPPEVAMLRRGYYQEYAGDFLNAGRSHYTVIDLDRHRLVQISRQIYTPNSFAQPFGDPDFTRYRLAFARRWTDGQSTEMDMVTIIPLRPTTLALFTCVANAAWARAPVASQWPTFTDTAVALGTLLDLSENGTLLMKRTAYDDALASTVDLIGQSFTPR